VNSHMSDLIKAGFCVFFPPSISMTVCCTIRLRKRGCEEAGLSILFSQNGGNLKLFFCIEAHPT